jgi:hypothetical protein
MPYTQFPALYHSTSLIFVILGGTVKCPGFIVWKWEMGARYKTRTGINPAFYSAHPYLPYFSIYRDISVVQAKLTSLQVTSLSLVPWQNSINVANYALHATTRKRRFSANTHKPSNTSKRF